MTVIEDLRSNKIIGSATLVIERKFIHSCGVRAFLEDVVVDDTYRGKQLGKLIVVTVTLLAEVLGCYKMSLQCKDKLVSWNISIMNIYTYFIALDSILPVDRLLGREGQFQLYDASLCESEQLMTISHQCPSEIVDFKTK